MKKLYLIFGALFLVVAGLSGCAKNNQVNNYHSYSYYMKHKKQAKTIYKACENNPKFVNQNSKKFDLSKANENCFNAQNVVKHLGNTFHKNFFNAAKKHYGE
ncbi:MAG: hypothetical protein EVJ46_00145 [Candidatus Acididesulfobacter guangdongensis]|uniref:Lipoprotein n=1 Tax=Acididesulfobacter guangdongensis TaxID=2597225 RepID=A0A519BHD6_ACIG2|nr:MAG: hypothetical protein EVJ46_00145 [Candidatus Acididesulfobacter guangdongensis]